MPNQPRPPRIVERDTDADSESVEQAQRALAFWQKNPVDFTLQALGAEPDPWQCDVLDTIALPDAWNVALRACHGVGKTTLLAWLIIWFTTTRPFSRLPTTAPTYNKQVKDVLWGEVHKWWRIAQQYSPWLAAQFELNVTRLQSTQHPAEWFAVGIASSQPINVEGYHAAHLLAIFDEAKGIPKKTWEAVAGMRTTQEAKLVVASTPGAPMGEYYKVFTEYRDTWRYKFVIHAFALKDKLRRRESPEYSNGGTYYSKRVRPQWIEDCRLEWGEDSPPFIARCIGDFPSLEGDVLIPYTWLEEAVHREDGAAGGPRVVSCDVARYGRDRTSLIVNEGGQFLHGETIARSQAESSAPEVAEFGVGPDPKQPRYRSVVATATACRRLREEWGASAIVVDDIGLGGGVTDILKSWGEKVIPINIGTPPTDRPRDPEEAKFREARHLLDSKFANLKAQMGWALRGAFETREIALLAPEHFLSDGKACQCSQRSNGLPGYFIEPLVAQTSMVRQDMDSRSRIKIVDPDDQDEMATSAGDLEGKKSPDHFHSMLLNWWIAGGAARIQLPIGKALNGDGIRRIGERRGIGGGYVGQASRIAAGVVAGQAQHVRDRYR